jgi:hypothetical protein
VLGLYQQQQAPAAAGVVEIMMARSQRTPITSRA